MRRFLLIFIAIVAMQTSALASYTLTWSNANSATAGQFSVDLYLNGVSTTNINDFGVQNADIRVLTSLGTLGVPVGNVGTMGFDSALVENPTLTTGTIAQVSFLGAGIGGGNSIRLGTFTVFSADGGNGSLTVTGLNGSADDITVNFDLLGGVDPIGSPAFFGASPSFDFTITAVPEPTSVVTASLLGLGGVWYARRKAKKKKKIVN